MKVRNVLTRISLLSAMLVVAGISAAQGQTVQNRIRANIPFDFSVANKKLPAGKYSVGRAQQNSDDTVLSILSSQGIPQANRLSIPVQTLHPRDKNTLVFHRHGDEYFLYQVWPAGESIGRQVLKSHSERELERQVSMNQKFSKNEVFETVTIVAGLQ